VLVVRQRKCPVSAVVWVNFCFLSEALTAQCHIPEIELFWVSLFVMRFYLRIVCSANSTNPRSTVSQDRLAVPPERFTDVCVSAEISQHFLRVL
jgi:hypothetical protein